jgi:hypothetical protein
VGILLGTAVESGGTMTVKNPGVVIPLGSGGVLEISTIERPRGDRQVPGRAPSRCGAGRSAAPLAD